MKVVVTSIGERTTDLTCSLLRDWGFDVVLFDEQESWREKFIWMIKRMDEDFIRIDADVIPLPMIKDLAKYKGRAWLVETQQLDLYSLTMKFGTPALYRREAIEMMRPSLATLPEDRPETFAWRLPQFRDVTESRRLLTGLHGFFQYRQDTERGILNRKERGQEVHDPEIIRRFMDLWTTRI